MTDQGEEIVEFHIAIPDQALTDLAQRLDTIRWPSTSTTSGWEQGVPLDYLQAFCRYWREQYDWRAAERRMNKTPQFTTRIDGLNVHFIHARSPHSRARPLLLLHGWPGSAREFWDLVDPLTDPEDPADAFHVVCPSLPGFGFSESPTEVGWGVRRIAAVILELMSRLGYQRFATHGADWGSVVTTLMAHSAPERFVGIHLTIPVVLSSAPDPQLLNEMTPFEKHGMERVAEFVRSGAGYYTQMATRPQTLAYGLADSPVAQAAWILEKFYEWTDCAGDPINAIGIDTLIDNIMLYWLTGSGPSASRLYWESMFDTPIERIGVPVGCSLYPFEHVRVPRKVAEEYLTNIVHWSERPRGGHFAALEQPWDMLNELRVTFRELR